MKVSEYISTIMETIQQLPVELIEEDFERNLITNNATTLNTIVIITNTTEDLSRTSRIGIPR